jgi:hypothetical protein
VRAVRGKKIKDCRYHGVERFQRRCGWLGPNGPRKRAEGGVFGGFSEAVAEQAAEEPVTGAIVMPERGRG